MLIPIVLAISSFFSLPSDTGLRIEEKWFPPSQDETAHFFVKYAAGHSKNIQENWTSLLFQKMMQEHLRDCPYLVINSPLSGAMIPISCDETQIHEVRVELLSILEKIKLEGFSKEFFEETKEEAKITLAPLETQDIEALDNIALVDFQPLIASLSIDTPQRQKINLQAETIESPNDFSELPLNDTEKKLIYKLISSMGEKNVIRLGLERKTYEKIGKKIHHVHPLRFLSYVFSDPTLKKAMKDISKSHFKWNGFIDGFSDKMRDEHSQNNLLRFIPAFAEQLHLNQDDITKYVHKKDWSGLVRFLIHS